jgi:UDP-sulfoquinovose synthase
MKTLICGWDGYIGTALVQRLLREGHSVVALDNYDRRTAVNEMNSVSFTDILDINAKKKELLTLGNIRFLVADIADPQTEYLHLKFRAYGKFDNIINLAHCPSGPFSMVDQVHANYVLNNNIIGTNNLLWAMKQYCPEAHYITIGSTGEYDHQSLVDIQEGYFKFTHNGRESAEMIFPRRPGSIYHTSKTASTYLIDLITRSWDIRCTDVQQAVVFGIYTDDIKETGIQTRLDTDQCFGTVLNRFCVQALIGEPLTIYGEGKHQRGFLSLNDSVQALMIAVNNPAPKGRVQVWNQLSEWQSINDIAQMVVDVAEEYSINVETKHIPTPRKESTSDHYYNYVSDILKGFGYVPSRTIKDEIRHILEYGINHTLTKEKRNILKANVKPTITWK